MSAAKLGETIHGIVKKFARLDKVVTAQDEKESAEVGVATALEPEVITCTSLRDLRTSPST